MISKCPKVVYTESQIIDGFVHSEPFLSQKECKNIGKFEIYDQFLWFFKFPHSNSCNTPIWKIIKSFQKSKKKSFKKLKMFIMSSLLYSF